MLVKRRIAEDCPQAEVAPVVTILLGATICSIRWRGAESLDCPANAMQLGILMSWDIYVLDLTAGADRESFDVVLDGRVIQLARKADCMQ